MTYIAKCNILPVILAQYTGYNNKIYTRKTS